VLESLAFAITSSDSSVITLCGLQIKDRIWKLSARGSADSGSRHFLREYMWQAREPAKTKGRTEKKGRKGREIYL